MYKKKRIDTGHSLLDVKTIFHTACLLPYLATKNLSAFFEALIGYLRKSAIQCSVARFSLHKLCIIELGLWFHNLAGRKALVSYLSDILFTFEVICKHRKPPNSAFNVSSPATVTISENNDSKTDD